MMCPSPVSIVRFCQAHVAETFRWIQNPELRKQFLMRGDPTWETHQAYFDRVLGDPSQCPFAICYHEAHVGNCGIKALDETRRRGEVWIYLGLPGLRGKGIGKEALALLIAEGRLQYRLSRFVVHLVETNTAARRLYVSAGFQQVSLPKEELEWRDRGIPIVKMVLDTGVAAT